MQAFTPPIFNVGSSVEHISTLNVRGVMACIPVGMQAAPWWYSCKARAVAGALVDNGPDTLTKSVESD